MKSDNIPLLWRKFFFNIANNIDYVNNYCNRPLNSFDRHCFERYLRNFLENNADVRFSNNMDEILEYAIYWESGE